MENQETGGGRMKYELKKPQRSGKVLGVTMNGLNVTPPDSS